MSTITLCDRCGKEGNIDVVIEFNYRNEYGFVKTLCPSCLKELKEWMKKK